jgi:hypothetical protein
MTQISGSAAPIAATALSGRATAGSRVAAGIVGLFALTGRAIAAAFGHGSPTVLTPPPPPPPSLPINPTLEIDC